VPVDRVATLDAVAAGQMSVPSEARVTLSTSASSVAGPASYPTMREANEQASGLT
jgi:hypothetical protein